MEGTTSSSMAMVSLVFGCACLQDAVRQGQGHPRNLGVMVLTRTDLLPSPHRRLLQCVDTRMFVSLPSVGGFGMDV